MPLKKVGDPFDNVSDTTMSFIGKEYGCVWASHAAERRAQCCLVWWHTQLLVSDSDVLDGADEEDEDEDEDEEMTEQGTDKSVVHKASMWGAASICQHVLHGPCWALLSVAVLLHLPIPLLVFPQSQGLPPPLASAHIRI